MRPETRLQSILKGHQIEERLVLRRLAEILSILERRRSVFEKALQLRKSLTDKLESLSGRKRRSAVISGRIGRVGSIDAYLKRMDTDLQRLQKEEQLRSSELQSAELRASGVQQELVDIRIERKRIERYIENLTRRKRAAGAAREEVTMDEMNSGRGKQRI